MALTPETFQQMVAEGMSFAAIAREHNLSRERVRQLARKHGIKSPYGAGVILRTYDPEVMRQMLADGKSVADIAEHYGRSKKKIYDALRHYGLRPQDQYGYQRNPARERALKLARAGFAPRPISVMLDRPENTVRWWITGAGVDRKPDIHMPTVKNNPDLVRRRFAEAMR